MTKPRVGQQGNAAERDSRRVDATLRAHEQALPALAGSVLLEVAPTGTTLEVAHGLGRKPSGYLVVWWEGAARNYPGVSSYDDRTITFVFEAAGSGRILLW